MSYREHERWATLHEKRFISEIGTHRLKAAAAGQRMSVIPPRHKLLRGYWQGLKQRTSWGGLNKAEIIAHLHVEMAGAGIDLTKL